MDAEAWNERYAGPELIWSAEPNRFLVPEVADLEPGRALDVACGEGRNAVWLAERGWDVVAVDFAERGLAKGRRRAEAAGVEVDWVLADATTSQAAEAFDLVIVFYLQLPAAAFAVALRAAAAALAPGGTLLVVGHHVRNLVEGHGGPKEAAVLHDPVLAASWLEEIDGIDVIRAEMIERPVDTPEGRRVALDSLVRARRAPVPRER